MCSLHLIKTVGGGGGGGDYPFGLWTFITFLTLGRPNKLIPLAVGGLMEPLLGLLLCYNVFRNDFPFKIDRLCCALQGVYVGAYLPSSCTAFPRPSRSIHFGDVSETNGRSLFRSDHVTRNGSTATKYRGLGTRQGASYIIQKGGLFGHDLCFCQKLDIMKRRL